MAEQLYYRDPYLCSFQANVVEVRQVGGHLAAVLDQTAFYPTGGGQPHDTGTLDGVPVVDVQVAADGAIVHLLSGDLAAGPVRGEVDRVRRLDHMQQHTGQHILSQAFLTACGAETVSFHLGEDASTIDLDRAPLTSEQAEGAANEVVMSGLPVWARFVDRETLAGLPLRKMPVVEGPVRIVQVGEFDWSPCGGTHVTNTAQIGPIKIARLERRKDQTRVYFLCGWRALADYGHKQDVLRDLTAQLTTGEEELLSSVRRLDAEIGQLRRTLREAQLELLGYEVIDWLAGAESVAGVRLVRQILDRDPTLLREAARLLTGHERVVALLATSSERPQFVFARSADVTADMGALMRAACAAVGGRGGGSAQFAQGGAPEGAAVDQALAAAAACLVDVQRGKS